MSFAIVGITVETGKIKKQMGTSLEIPEQTKPVQSYITKLNFTYFARLT